MPRRYATQPAELKLCMVPLFRQVGRCINSPNFQVAKGALFWWNNEHIVDLIAQSREVILPIMFEPLEKNVQSHWNQEINGLTNNVRKMFIQMDADLFEECSNQFLEKEAMVKEMLEQRELKWEKLESIALGSGGDVKYGTRHALVFEYFQPSMTTSGLENMLEKFNYHDVMIRWINDTTALAVFITPAIALEACKSIKCPFTVRVLGESDVLLNSIPERDLEPPRQRPKTSARTAQKVIAHGMGMKLPSTSFGQKELKEQEEARRQWIISRHNPKDDA